MRALPFLLSTVLLMLVSYAHALPETERSAQVLIRTDHKIRNQEDAGAAALSAIPETVPMKEHFFARVVALSRAPHNASGRLKAGEVIWLVEVTNSAVSDVHPAPEGVYCVRAIDGVVFRLSFDL